MISTRIMAVSAVACLLLLSGCASRQWNQPITGSTSARTYRLSDQHAGDNAKDVFVILAFSGGGMRSAAFSYGTLKALRDTEVTIHGKTRSLLDEVDVISSVSFSGSGYFRTTKGIFCCVTSKVKCSRHSQIRPISFR